MTPIWRSIGREFSAAAFVSHTLSLRFLHLSVKHHFILQNIQSTRLGHMFLKLVHTNYFNICFKYFILCIYNSIIIIIRNSCFPEIWTF